MSAGRGLLKSPCSATVTTSPRLRSIRATHPHRDRDGPQSLSGDHAPQSAPSDADTPPRTPARKYPAERKPAASPAEPDPNRDLPHSPYKLLYIWTLRH